MDCHQAILRCDTTLWVTHLAKTTSTTSPSSHLTHPSYFSYYPHSPLSPSPSTLTLLLLPHTTVKDLVMTICVYVDEDTAPVLTSHKEQFDDILVLHLEKGKDFFISSLRPLLPLSAFLISFLFPPSLPLSSIPFLSLPPSLVPFFPPSLPPPLLC